MYLKVVVAEMALHPELEDGRGIVVSNARFLGVVAHTHSQMLTTSSTPDVVWEFKPRKPKKTTRNADNQLLVKMHRNTRQAINKTFLGTLNAHACDLNTHLTSLL